MALHVLIAHTGKRLKVDPALFASLDAFKAWVAAEGAIAVPNQIILTGTGKAVKAQTLLTEKEILVYNRQVIQVSSSNTAASQVFQIPIPHQYEPESSPDTITDQNDLQAWRDLFMARRTWALKLVDDCRGMSDLTQMRYGEIEVISHTTETAAENLRNHVANIDEKFADVQTWATDLLKNQQTSGKGRQHAVALLALVPATSAMVRFIVGRDPRNGRQKACLEDLLDIGEVHKADSLVRTAIKQFDIDFNHLSGEVDTLMNGVDRIYEKIEPWLVGSIEQRKSDSIQLMEDIEAIAKKVSSDYENVLGYANTPKSVSQASKSALLHTKNFLPNLRKRSLEMDGILMHATETRNKTAVESVEIMQSIGRLNTMCTEIISMMDRLDLSSEEENAFHVLDLVDRLPVIYASFVAEAIRRREWNEKIKSDSSTLANEFATFQDEEDRRRKKWQRNTGVMFGFDKAEGKATGLEVNLLGDEEHWPQAARQDLDQLMVTLLANDVPEDIRVDVEHIISDLNSPTKQQGKRSNAFKNGSIHEAALGRSALLIRGDHDLVRSLQDDKSKMESKLKGSESRIRKLEGLLHQHSQISRSSTGNVFQPPSSPIPDRPDTATPIASPLLNDHPSRRSSVSSRRFSAHQTAEEKTFTQRLISVEAELIAERERAAGLEKEVSARVTASKDIRAQMEEANSTKQDLMKNLEAQQREFGAERKSLEFELRRLKEEYEEDMERFMGSREHVDERVRSLTNELEKLRAEHVAEKQKAQGQVDFLRNDAKLQRETNESLVQQLARLREENKELTARTSNAESANVEQLGILQDLHSIILPNATLPNDQTVLAETLSSKSTDIVTEWTNHKRDIALAYSDRDSAQATISELKIELTETKEKLVIEEGEAAHLRETLGEERAKFGALEVQVEDERKQLANLRAKFADGETGSEALKSRVAEEERKVTTLSEELASSHSQIGSLEEQLRTVQEKYQNSQSKLEKVNSRLDARTMRAKDLTQRAYAQNDRLYQLLDRLSYSVAREGDSMIITRIPRADRTSANDSSDPGSSMRRSVSGPVPRKAMVESGDLELLYWMQNEDSETEAEKYDAYLNAIGKFDIEAFCATIYDRMKNLEHTARKYTRDARSYREKSHVAQKQAHEKIAFRNFKEGDLALFLPTRNQTAGAWAAFNVGAPHYFLREQDSHKLRTRDWLLARIHKIEERVVDLSKSVTGHISGAGDRGSIASGADSYEDDNPFDLSDGLRWYLIEASEEKPGAPSTPGLGKSTVATAPIDVSGSIRHTKKSSSSGVDGVSRTLSRSLDSRRSSSNSKKVAPGTPISGSPYLGKAPSTLSQPSAGTLKPSDDTSSAASITINMPPPPPQLLTADSSNLENNATASASTGTSPGKKSMIWDSLWTIDMSVESGKVKK